MKKLDNYLLTRYPLLWNLRIHYIWPALIINHLLFFATGFLSVSFPASFRSGGVYPAEATVVMGMLVPIILGILWLVYFLRHNAFRKYYPLHRGRLAGEWCLLFITAIGFCTFLPSHQWGVYSHLRSLGRDTDIVKEIDIAALAHHFIPFNPKSFSRFDDCVREAAEKNNYDAEADTRTAAAYGADTTGTSLDTFSYLHYCNSEGSFENNLTHTRSAFGNDSIAKRWLHQGRRDSVLYILDQYLAICTKYGAKYRFMPAEQVSEIFATPGFLVRTRVGRYDPARESEFGRSLDEAGDEPHSFIEEVVPHNALTIIETARKGWLTLSITQFILYLSLGIAILIFSFRITSLRTWFTALIGAGIWLAICAVMVSFLRYESSGIGFGTFLLLLIILFLATAIYLISRRERKRAAGVVLLWSAWSFSVFALLIFAFIRKLTTPDVYYEIDEHSRANTLYHWIDNHWLHINLANIVFVMLAMLLVYIPLARKWHAAPKE